MISSIEAAIEAIRRGEMIIVVDDEDRENEGDLVMAAEFADPVSINFMVKYGRGLLCAPITKKRAKDLNLKVMEKENSEAHHCNFTVSVDYKHGTTTGISAPDRSLSFQALCREDVKASDFARPGHIFPLIAQDGGVLVRAGHTEAAVDFARLAGLYPAGVICEILKEDGTMARLPDLIPFAKEHGLLLVTIKDLIAYREKTEKMVRLAVKTPLNTAFGEFMMHVYKNAINDLEHIAMVYGEPNYHEPVLVRVHSECMTGDVFHSLHCDCQAQLHEAMKRIQEKGSGILLYMRQEGRGIGLINKLKAYNLQAEGLDTVEANEKLGFKADLREYGLGAQILCDLGVKKLDLLTNNPTKIVGLESFGLQIHERIPLRAALQKENQAYWETKVHKMGHLES